MTRKTDYSYLYSFTKVDLITPHDLKAMSKVVSGTKLSEDKTNVSHYTYDKYDRVLPDGGHRSQRRRSHI